MHCTALAFDSVEHIMRDMHFGWLLRYTRMAHQLLSTYTAHAVFILAATEGFLSTGRRTGFFPYRDEKFFVLGSKPVSLDTGASVEGCTQELA
jgi:hypothetical protein